VINGIAVEDEKCKKWRMETLQEILIYITPSSQSPQSRHSHLFPCEEQTMPIAQINRLLAHQPFTMLEDDKNPSLLLWNVREAPSTFLRLSDSPSRNLYPHELASPATQPPVTHLRIFCGMFPDSDSWRIEARHSGNGGVVTVRDVLMAIHGAFQQPMSFPNQDFSALSAKTQTRILDVYHARVRSTGPHALVTWEAGIQRGDCLMKHTWFGGLSLPFVDKEDMENTCILSLRIADVEVTSPTGIVPAPSPFR
jgi:hypothetical protein